MAGDGSSEGASSVRRPAAVSGYLTAYDIVLSYASEDRQYVEQVAEQLVRGGLRVYYDRHLEGWSAGEQLSAHLRKTYSRARHFCVVFLSQHYAAKAWTTFELKVAQARAIQRPGDRDYIIPAAFDGTSIPMLDPETIHVDLRRKSPQEFSALVMGRVEAKRRAERRSLLWSSLLFLAVAISATGLLQSLRFAQRPPVWLVTRYVPIMSEIARVSSDLQQFSGTYLLGRQSTPEVLGHQITDLNNTIATYNCVSRHLSAGNLHAEVSSIQSAPIRAAAANLARLEFPVDFRAVERTYTPGPRPLVLQDVARIAELQNALAVEWKAEADNLESISREAERSLSVMDSVLLAELGVTVPTCRNQTSQAR